jgi:nanoRNase/pAp phosphatase (c-di-AMP/oligoRNAs hydrolase)
LRLFRYLGLPIKFGENWIQKEFTMSDLLHIRQLPDPDAIAAAISHVKALNQNLFDAIDLVAKRAVENSKPPVGTKLLNERNPLVTDIRV